jgi:ssRNA-specific RNase YbeY (16S rRNA maturation enzyme)
MSRDAGPRARVTRQRRGGVSITSTELAALVVRALRTSDAPPHGEVALTLVDDATIAMLNKTHMGKRGPTDVLSFPLLDPHEYPARLGVRRAARPRRRVVRAPQAGVSLPLGDIVISVDRAIEQARKGRGGTDGPATPLPMRCASSPSTAPFTSAAGIMQRQRRRLRCGVSRSASFARILQP